MEEREIHEIRRNLWKNEKFMKKGENFRIRGNIWKKLKFMK